MEKFSRTLHGYNPDEVNSYLDNVISKVEEMMKSINEKDAEIEKLKKELTSTSYNKDLYIKAQKFDDLSKTLNKAIVMAEETGEHIRRLARQERDLMLEEAKKNASIIVNDALARSEKLEYEGALLRKNIIVFKRKLRANLQAQLELVDDIEVNDDLK